MPKLIINKLGPVETCELECSQFMNFTGFQASERVQLPKAIYYFRTIKDDIIELAKIAGIGCDTCIWSEKYFSIEHGITFEKSS